MGPYVPKDVVKMQDEYFYKSVGAKGRNYVIIDPTIGKKFNFAEGTRLQDSQVFAGRGTKASLHEGVAEGLVKKYGGKPENWQHSKGFGTVDMGGELVKVEVHWFQEESVGKVGFRIKKEL